MKIPQAFIDDVLSRIDIISIIEPRISLKKTGRANYSGLCPFHQEKTASFTVNESKQFYYCFGCKASGNAIGFLMAYEKLSFIEAIENLASQVNLSLPVNSFSKEEEKKPSLNFLQQSANYYQQQLSKHHQAKEYLAARGLSQELIQKFQIGFAPNSWDNLLKFFGKSLAIQKQLFDIGMLIQKEDESVYDRFRERIMFPIHNRRGQIIAFGGRSIGDHLPKYLNSPETNYFHKSRELYGLYHVLQANKTLKRIIVVEGYLDVIALHQYGFTETVATLGTAISSQHIQTLLRYAPSLVFCFDGDQAGKAAAWRSLEIALSLMNTGIEIRFLFLPNNEDPDSYVRKMGSQAFTEKLSSALALPDFFFSKLQSETEISSLAGKTRFVHLVEKYLSKLPKGIFLELMYKRLSELIGLNLQKIEEILTPHLETNKSIPVVTTQSWLQPLKLSISLLLQCPTLLKKVDVPEHLETVQVKGIDLLIKLISLIKAHDQQTTGALLEYLKDEAHQALLMELAAQDLLIPDEAWQPELQGALDRLLEIDKEERIQSLLAKGKKEGLTPEEKILLQKLLTTRR